MTTEEKARAYDKALNIAREILDHTSENYLCTHLTKEDIKDMYIRFFPELEESEDEKIRKSLISYLHGLGEFDYPDKKTYNDWLKWVEKQKSYVSPQMVADAYLRGCNETEEKLLEKQGEQKLQIEKLPSEIKTIGESLDFTTQEECDEYNQMVSDLIMSDGDKIIPKFKVGDWITNGDYTWKIVEVKPLDYMLQSQDGNIVYDTISYVDEQFHSFTIQDAKDGDVLHSTGFDSECIFIFNGLDNWKFDEPNGDRAVATAHCCITVSGDKMEFGIQGPDCIEVNTIKPATKIQHDLLFQKMKEAGYEWNEEKKELKKFYIIDEGKDEMDYCFTKMMNGEKVSSAWGKEDEEIMSGLLSFLLINTSDQWAKYGKWILSLKERMRR